jgi:hypothetical protein
MLRAELSGGRDAVTVIWLGRNRITGIEPGRALSVEGTLALRRGRPVIYNPRYELGQGPVTKERGLEPAGGSGPSGSGVSQGVAVPPRAGTGPRRGGSVPG